MTIARGAPLDGVLVPPYSNTYGCASWLHTSDIPRQCAEEQIWEECESRVGPYREAAMALTFEPERIVYDTEEELLRFFATDDVLLIRCAVSKATLAALEDSALTDPDAIVIAYHRNRELI